MSDLRGTVSLNQIRPVIVLRPFYLFHQQAWWTRILEIIWERRRFRHNRWLPLPKVSRRLILLYRRYDDRYVGSLRNILPLHPIDMRRIWWLNHKLYPADQFAIQCLLFVLRQSAQSSPVSQSPPFQRKTSPLRIFNQQNFNLPAAHFCSYSYTSA